MSDIKCPSCQSKMELVHEPDLDYEKCISCDGVFFGREGTKCTCDRDVW